MANLIYRALGTRFTFEPSGGDAAITLTNLGTGAGRISAQYDRGAGSIPGRIVGAMRTAFETEPVADEAVRLYLIEGWEFRDGGTPAVKEGGDLPSTDSAIADEDRFINGGIIIGSLIVPPSPAASTEYISLPLDFYTTARYIQIGVWDATADNLEDNAGSHEIALYEVSAEVQ